MQAYVSDNFLVKEKILQKENLACKHVQCFTGDNNGIFSEKFTLFILMFRLSTSECVSACVLVCMAANCS